MANQPKKYKKFVATAATATLVASAIVPVASAAGFTDVAGNSHEAAINSLADKGIINGYSDGTFKPNQTINRGQVVKLLGRWLETEGFEAPADWDTKQRFNDVPLTAEKELVKYAALAKDAGVFAGSNGNLNHTQTMQRQQMAVVLVRAINEIYELDLVKEYKAAKFTSEISDLDKAFSAEQREAITALEFAELTNAANLPGKAFNPANSITRGQFASFLDRTINLEVAPTKAAVKAINNTTVEVTFDEEVDNVQALKFEIKDLEVKNAAVKQTNKKVVVLTTAPQTADKEYTVSLAGEEIGKFKGVTAVIPTKVDIVDQSVQGKLGQQVTVKAQVTVAEGQSKAGIPVTLFVPGSPDGIKAPVTVEALTDENGVATHTYTRYAATTDAVTVYATGDRSKFSTGYVFWGVDTIISITEVTEGATINNGANKTYKVTYKDAVTGKPVANKNLNVSVLENINVTPDKLQNVTVNGVPVKQLTNDTASVAAQISTDSKGEATFTVSGTNTAEVTPVVFEANNTKDSNNNVVLDYKYDASDLQVRGAKVKFAALQSDYKIDVTREGGENAAIGYENGREYKVVVKNKNGEVAKNEVVNIAFNEDVDRVISTNTDAYFVELDDNDNRIYKNDTKHITVTTDSKGEASFIIANDKESTYGTPVAWIDINSAYVNKQGILDEGEPKTVAPISYFEAEKLEGASLKVKNANGKFKSTADLKGDVPAEFKVELVNQSGEQTTIGTFSDVTYTVYNTGSSVLYIDNGQTTVSDNDKISPNRSKTVKSSDVLKVRSLDGKTGSVKVVATGKATHDKKEFNFIAKESTAKFTSTTDVTNLEKGNIVSFDTAKKTLTIEGKKAIKYAGETGKKYAYRDEDNRPVSEANFEKALKAAATAGANNGLEVTYEVKGDDITFYLKKVTANAPVDTDSVATDASTALKAAKDKAAPLVAKEADYTVESFKALTDALKLTESTTADKEAKTKAINAAIDGLKLKADVDADTALKAAKDKVTALKEADYTAASYAAVTAAGKLPETTNVEKATKTKAIEDAITALVKMKDATAPTATAVLAGQELAITFTSDVAVTAGPITIGGEAGTVAQGSTAKDVKVSFTTAAPTADGTATITVKTAATATEKEGNFTYEVKFDSKAATPDKLWTVTLKQN
ncbi:S-layer homology domain-containing protein [Lysinibacillus agricola]|uniref:S-layer homology domain-containing protein n=1 Tax=Lysinibacillus agricola TaxID=2590012 RepID=UPI003C233BDC